jgi:hypothetical protein
LLIEEENSRDGKLRSQDVEPPGFHALRNRKGQVMRTPLTTDFVKGG